MLPDGVERARVFSLAHRMENDFDCGDLSELYREVYGDSVHFEQYGFETLAEFLTSIPRIQMTSYGRFCIAPGKELESFWSKALDVARSLEGSFSAQQFHNAYRVKFETLPIGDFFYLDEVAFLSSVPGLRRDVRGDFYVMDVVKEEDETGSQESTSVESEMGPGDEAPLPQKIDDLRRKILDVARQLKTPFSLDEFCRAYNIQKGDLPLRANGFISTQDLLGSIPEIARFGASKFYLLSGYEQPIFRDINEKRIAAGGDKKENVWFAPYPHGPPHRPFDVPPPPVLPPPCFATSTPMTTNQTNSECSSSRGRKRNGLEEKEPAAKMAKIEGVKRTQGDVRVQERLLAQKTTSDSVNNNYLEHTDVDTHMQNNSYKDCPMGRPVHFPLKKSRSRQNVSLSGDLPISDRTAAQFSTPNSRATTSRGPMSLHDRWTLVGGRWTWI